MSVINQMLKDLDQRRQQGLEHGGVLDGLGWQPDRMRRTRLPLLILVLLLIAAGGWLAYEYGVLQGEPEPTASARAQTAPRRVEPLAASESATAVQRLIEPEPVTEPVAVAMPEAEAAVLPVSADESVATPMQSAVVTGAAAIAIAQIQGVSPSPLPASGRQAELEVFGSGFVEPLQVFVAWADGRQEKQLGAWQVSILAEDRLRLRFNPGTQSDSWRLWVVNASGESSAVYPFQVEAGRVEASEEPEIQVGAPPAQQAASSSSPVVKTARQRSPADRAKQQMDRANRLLTRGETAAGEQALREAIALDPGLHAARELLAGLLIQQGRYANAGELLDAGMAHGALPPSSVLLRARVYAEQGQEGEAIRVLEASRPALAKATDYYALLAALYQRQSRHGDAALVYSQLIRINPRQGVWQMGLGISYEALGQRDSAVSAYQAAEASGLQPALRDYVSQRLRALR